VWEITVPYWRLDINLEEDLVEEVARMYGYENIPPHELRGKQPEKIDQSLFELIDNLKTNLVKAGLTEIETYSFYSTETLNNLNIDQEKSVKVANPISSETEYLRDQLWPNLLQKTDENLKNGVDEVAIFELGKVYKLADHAIPNEEYRLALALTGDQAIEELSSIIQQSLLHIGGVTIEQAQGTELFHPVKFAKIFSKGKEIGFLAEVHPRLTYKFGIEKRVAILEVKVSPENPG
ncbi:hypothetical protein HY385_00535, partial [Candidatus Daviesbacteria bacterium]|nr:hypothetical protein [Candidatus Daviesbacteria bacterium]